jgi:hypothetical protein
LRDAGVGYKALDLTGKKTTREIHNEIIEKSTAGHIRIARNCFDALLTIDSSFVDNCLDKIKDNLSMAGAGYNVLDLTGTKTSKAMKCEVWTRAIASTTAENLPRPSGTQAKLQQTPSIDG